MDEAKSKLLSFLLENDGPSLSTELAEKLGLSVRTIKKYVKEINSLSDERAVLSSNRGYSINRSVALSLLEKESDIPQNYQDRSFYLIKKILVEHQQPNVFDLCDLLFISYSTLKSDIKKMNTSFQGFKVHFVIKNNTLNIIGAEKDKRSLLSNVIFEETNTQLANLSILNESFLEKDVQLLSSILSKNFKNDTFYINNFSFTNLLLHFAILVERVREGHSLSANKVSIPVEEQLIIDNLAKDVEEAFSITLNLYEKSEIYILFKSNVNYSIKTTDDEHLKAFIGAEYLTIVQEITDKIEDLYSINLGTETFSVPFALHLKELVTRSALKKFKKNPFTDNIKKSFSIIYDIAVFVSFELFERFEIEIIEDEISFIAIHIGAEIDRQKDSGDKLKCVLLCPKYLDLEKELANKLTKAFGEFIKIDYTVESYEQLKTLNFDLLFTIVDSFHNNYYDFILIPPFNVELRKNEIQESIAIIQQKRKRNTVIENFDRYVNKNVFLMVEDISRDTTIDLLCKQMEEQGFVSHTFKANVLDRESRSSTSFGHVAIPHSVHMEAIHTNIGIAISKNGILWGENKVHIVLLIAINKLDKQIFLQLYDSLLALFDNEIIKNILKNSIDFDTFKKIILAEL